MARNALILDGVVINIGIFNPKNAPAPSGGAIWVETEEWVEVGCKYDGNKFVLADGTRPPKDHIDSLAAAADESDMLERLRALKDSLPDMRKGVGTTPQRLDRIEAAVVALYRFAIKTLRE